MLRETKDSKDVKELQDIYWENHDIVMGMAKKEGLSKNLNQAKRQQYENARCVCKECSRKLLAMGKDIV